MSEDVMRTLATFTPVAVDRDALLFAAGRASVRTPRAWKWLAGLLAASQAVTLAVLLAPSDERRGLSPPNAPASAPASFDDTPPSLPEPSSYIALTRVTDWEKVPFGGDEPRRSFGPPLSVRSSNID